MNWDYPPWLRKGLLDLAVEIRWLEENYTRYNTEQATPEQLAQFSRILVDRVLEFKTLRFVNYISDAAAACVVAKEEAQSLQKAGAKLKNELYAIAEAPLTPIARITRFKSVYNPERLREWAEILSYVYKKEKASYDAKK